KFVDEVDLQVLWDVPGRDHLLQGRVLRVQVIRLVDLFRNSVSNAEVESIRETFQNHELRGVITRFPDRLVLLGDTVDQKLGKWNQKLLLLNGSAVQRGSGNPAGEGIGNAGRQRRRTESQRARGQRIELLGHGYLPRPAADVGCRDQKI